MAPYLHPISAGLLVALLVFVGSLGLRARKQPRQAAALLASHARWAPVVLVLAVVSWIGGTLSTLWFRPDLEVGTSAHFRIGCVMVAMLVAGGVTSRRMNDARVRMLHPFLGAAAILLAAAQVFFGLQITP